MNRDTAARAALLAVIPAAAAVALYAVPAVVSNATPDTLGAAMLASGALVTLCGLAIIAAGLGAIRRKAYFRRQTRSLPKAKPGRLAP